MTCKKCLYKKMCTFCLTNEEAKICKQFVDQNDYIKVGKYKKIFSTQSVNKTIGQIIFEKRKAKGLTQNKLAEKIDVCAGTLASWEHGDAYPSALYLPSLADVFDCTIDEICGREVKINE